MAIEIKDVYAFDEPDDSDVEPRRDGVTVMAWPVVDLDGIALNIIIDDAETGKAYECQVAAAEMLKALKRGHKVMVESIEFWREQAER